MSSTTTTTKKERNFPELELTASTQPVLVVQSPKTPTLSRKLKAVSLDSDPPPGLKQSATSLEVGRDVFSMPNTPKKQLKQKLSCDFDGPKNSVNLTPNLASSNLKRFASNTSISGSQTLKTLPEIMTLHDFTDTTRPEPPPTTTTKPNHSKTKGLLERRGSNASLTIDLGSNSNISDIKPVVLRLNTAKSVSNLYLSSQQQNSALCVCRSKKIAGTESCGNCTIYESVPSKANQCKTKCNNSTFKKCSRCLCSSAKCKRKSLSNENLYVPPCNFCASESQQKHCKANRKAYYPRQPDVDASQLLSDDFKLHLQNVQYLQTAGSALTITDLKASCQTQRVPRLHQEFWEVPLNLQEKCLVSGSQTRNRYRGVLPNEHSRVILPGSQSYIHANYIKGPDYSETAYIATQGPMAHTCEDFWQMVWFSKSNCIVMLTNLIEKGRNKCELYFPLGKNHDKPSFFCVKTTKIEDKFTFEHAKQPEEIIIKYEELNEITHGHFKITHLKQTVIGDCVLRVFCVSDGVESREINHFWYPHWQDHKMASPQHVLHLAKIVLQVMDANRQSGGERRESLEGGGGGGGGGVVVKINRAKRSKNVEEEGRKPIVVHCSAGIGRTGCFLAILNGMQQLRSSSSVDVLAILCSLRLNRGGLVQTAEQYELVHRVLSLYCDELEG